MSTNTRTILNVKTDKELKAQAKEVASELGLPLSTVINSFLKQFVRDKEVTFSANELRPSPYLIKCIEEARAEYEAGESAGPMDADEFIAHLKTL